MTWKENYFGHINKKNKLRKIKNRLSSDFLITTFYVRIKLTEVFKYQEKKMWGQNFVTSNNDFQVKGTNCFQHSRT